MDTPIIVLVLIIALVGGHLVQIVFERDDWPFAAYPMYAHVLVDRVRNPFVPLRPEHAEFEMGFLVLSAIAADGTGSVLTGTFYDPLLLPLDRLIVLRMLNERYKRGDDLGRAVGDFATWVGHQNARARTPRDLVALELQLYLWRTVPAHPERHHVPDEIQVVYRAPIARLA
jgi:hypothetical protein